MFLDDMSSSVWLSRDSLYILRRPDSEKGYERVCAARGQHQSLVKT